MADDSMRYDLLAREALRGVVRLALERAASPEGLPGNHHFYITFGTHYEGVVAPPHLRDEYPDDMTIVIKHHYWDLEVGPDGFSVGLSFHGKQEHIQVPYAAISTFLDPEAQFVLELPRTERRPQTGEPVEPPRGDAEVVSLDAFRKR